MLWETLWFSVFFVGNSDGVGLVPLWETNLKTTCNIKNNNISIC